MANTALGSGQTKINPSSSAHTQVSDPLRNFRFVARFIPSDLSGSHPTWAKNLAAATMGFTSISGLNTTVENIPYREGGYNTTVHQIPGQSTYSPLTFQRGVKLGNMQNWDWIRQLHRVTTAAAASPTPIADYSFRASIDIFLLHTPIPGAGFVNLPDTLTDVQVDAQWKVYNAWVTNVAFSDLNAGDNALLVEQMTVVHEGLNMILANADGTMSNQALG